jgi:hypothetical protein
MARGKATPPQDNTPEYLTKPRDQFANELQERIELGEALLSRDINNQTDLAQLSQDYTLWNEYNTELISRSFSKTNGQYYRDYTYTPPYIGVVSLYERRQSTFQEQLEEHRSPIISKVNRLKKLKERVPLIEELPGLKPVKKDESKQDLALKNLERIFKRFHKVALSLRNRHGQRPTILIQDEYDQQDLLRSLLKLHFDDIREEDYSPSVAGGNSRIDFVLTEEKIVIETKMTNDSLNDKNIGSQLLIDIGRYEKHPDCEVLVVFVYDRGDHIHNEIGIKNDLERRSTPTLKVKVYIEPK